MSNYTGIKAASGGKGWVLNRSLPGFTGPSVDRVKGQVFPDDFLAALHGRDYAVIQKVKREFSENASAHVKYRLLSYLLQQINFPYYYSEFWVLLSRMLEACKQPQNTLNKLLKNFDGKVGHRIGKQDMPRTMSNLKQLISLCDPDQPSVPFVFQEKQLMISGESVLYWVNRDISIESVNDIDTLEEELPICLIQEIDGRYKASVYLFGDKKLQYTQENFVSKETAAIWADSIIVYCTMVNKQSVLSDGLKQDILFQKTLSDKSCYDILSNFHERNAAIRDDVDPKSQSVAVCKNKSVKCDNKINSNGVLNGGNIIVKQFLGHGERYYCKLIFEAPHPLVEQSLEDNTVVLSAKSQEDMVSRIQHALVRYFCYKIEEQEKDVQAVYEMIRKMKVSFQKEVAKSADRFSIVSEQQLLINMDQLNTFRQQRYVEHIDSATNRIQSRKNKSVLLERLQLSSGKIKVEESLRFDTEAAAKQYADHRELQQLKNQLSLSEGRVIKDNWHNTLRFLPVSLFGRYTKEAADDLIFSELPESSSKKQPKVAQTILGAHFSKSGYLVTFKFNGVEYRGQAKREGHLDETKKRVDLAVIYVAYHSLSEAQKALPDARLYSLIRAVIADQEKIYKLYFPECFTIHNRSFEVYPHPKAIPNPFLDKNTKNSTDYHGVILDNRLNRIKYVVRISTPKYLSVEKRGQEVYKTKSFDDLQEAILRADLQLLSLYDDEVAHEASKNKANPDFINRIKKLIRGINHPQKNTAFWKRLVAQRELFEKLIFDEVGHGDGKMTFPKTLDEVYHLAGLPNPDNPAPTVPVGLDISPMALDPVLPEENSSISICFFKRNKSSFWCSRDVDYEQLRDLSCIVTQACPLAVIKHKEGHSFKVFVALMLQDGIVEIEGKYDSKEACAQFANIVMSFYQIHVLGAVVDDVFCNDMFFKVAPNTPVDCLDALRDFKATYPEVYQVLEPHISNAPFEPEDDSTALDKEDSTEKMEVDAVLETPQGPEFFKKNGRARTAYQVETHEEAYAQETPSKDETNKRQKFKK